MQKRMITLIDKRIIAQLKSSNLNVSKCISDNSLVWPSTNTIQWCELRVYFIWTEPWFFRVCVGKISFIFILFTCVFWWRLVRGSSYRRIACTQTRTSLNFFVYRVIVVVKSGDLYICVIIIASPQELSLIISDQFTVIDDHRSYFTNININ